MSSVELKDRLREHHLVERDEQLREGSVRQFVEEMERPRIGPNGWVSIYSLMRDGVSLARDLRQLSSIDQNARLAGLRTMVQPYLEFVESGKKCHATGLLLTDVWRYFRHTWVSKYKSLPGRSVLILVRDAAIANHPVIGIAALGSSTAQQSLRDRWIGWEADVFIDRIRTKCTPRELKWAKEAIKRLTSAIYTKDILHHRILSRHELHNPTHSTIARLHEFSRKAANAHQLNPEAAQHKRNDSGSNVDWEKVAESDLFLSKRLKMLGQVLKIRLLINPWLKKRDRGSCLEESDVQEGIRLLIRLVKSEHVGVDMMDVVVCGAIAPYSHLLGGKLVCSLLMSPEVTKYYRNRYRSHESIIASGMKGASVVRTPNLVLLGTTSLYGIGSSQYNRIRIDASSVGGQPEAFLEYTELGVSEGFGSYHFSQSTVDLLETYLARSENGRKVNSIFGEGVNPLMRKIRDGLTELGLPGRELLRHGNSRVVYGVPLASNFRDVLTGFSTEPDYILPLRFVRDATEKLAEFWRRRWLSGRSLRSEVLDQVEHHTLTHPIQHGARVNLPRDLKQLSRSDVDLGTIGHRKASTRRVARSTERGD